MLVLSIPLHAAPLLAFLTFSDADYPDTDPDWKKVNADFTLIRWRNVNAYFKKKHTKFVKI